MSWLDDAVQEASGSHEHEAAQQGDEADEADASDGASQLIPGVLWTLAERAKEEAGGGASRGVHVRPRRHPASSWKPECVESFGATA